MPANLTPRYLKAESTFRQATTPQEQLDCLRLMLREIPKHKGTDKLQADLKSKISRLKSTLEKLASQPGSARATHKIPKQGAGRVLLIGAPNTGKSQLLASLTNAQPEIAPYPFTTRAATLGMLYFEDCPLQLIEVPPITADFMDDATLDLVRGADLVLLVMDVSSDTAVEDTCAVLERFSTTKTRLGATSRLDATEIGVSYTRTTVLANKVDVPDATERLAFIDEFLQIPFGRLLVSGAEQTGLDALRQHVFDRLELVRVYTKHPQQVKPDMTKPFVIQRGETLVDVAEQVHADVAAALKSGRVWPANISSTASQSQISSAPIVVPPEYQPADRDVVELRTS